MGDNPFLKILLAIAFLVVLVVFAVIMTKPSIPAEGEAQISVYYASPTPTPPAEVTKPGEPTPQPGTPASEPAAEEVYASEEVEADSRSITRAAIAPYKLRIEDAMGVPIAAGRVSIGSRDVAFREGVFSLEPPFDDSVSIQVSAEGYQSIARTLEPVSGGERTLVLEYLTDFEFRVYEKSKIKTVPGATVKIWKADNPKRPIAKKSHLSLGIYYSRGHDSIATVLDGEDCVLEPSSTPSSDFERMILPDGLIRFPGKGDKVTALGSCCWYEGIFPRFDVPEYHYLRYGYIPQKQKYSCRLRIWDALYFSALREVMPRTHAFEKCELMREDSEPCFTFIGFPQMPDGLEVFETLTADTGGRCSIKNLVPALYYAQAEKDSKISEMFPLHPACGGALLTLYGGSQVRVNVYCRGLENSKTDVGYVNGADVKLTSLDSTGMASFSGVTGDSYVLFKDVPFGRYRLEVESVDGSYKSEVDIDSPFESFKILLDEWERYSISGRVLERETQKPVPDYELIARGDENGFRTSIVKTDREGNFIFHDVPPGQYNLTGEIADGDISGLTYLFYGTDESPKTAEFLQKTSRNGNSGFLQIEVVDRNIENLEAFVTKVYETKFSGIVTGSDGQPAPAAHLMCTGYAFGMMVHEIEWRTTPTEPQTDTEGRFSFSIFSGDAYEGQQFDFGLKAMTGQIIPAHWKPNPNEKNSYSMIEEKFVATQRGEISVSGSVGEVFDNLHISLEASGNHTVWVHVLIEPSDAQVGGGNVYAGQNMLDLPVIQIEDYQYRIDYVSAGELDLLFYQHGFFPVETPSGTRSVTKFREEKFSVTVPEDKPEVYVDLTPCKAGYLWGVVVDGNKNPLPNIPMRIECPTNGEVRNKGTDANGAFFCDTLIDGYPYSINVLHPESREVITRINGVEASQGDIVIPVPDLAP